MTTKRNKQKTPSVAIELLERMAEVLKLLAHAHRLQIVDILERANGAPVFQISAQLGLPQAVTSQHLNAMKRIGLLRAERRGKEVWYSIADPRALTILDCIRHKAKSSSSLS